MSNRSLRHTTFPARQRGAALVVALLLLVIMTLIGLASLRGTAMEERMSANMYDRSVSFQSVEAALREAESRLLQPATAAAVPTTPGTCTNGLCATPVPEVNVPARMDDPAFAGWVAASKVSDIAGTPEYFVEYMGDAPGWPLCDREVPRHPNCMRPRYRVSARSNAGEGRSSVVLQSSFAGS